ncbi:hypothetical protein [Geodermatophilus sp. URMC 62]|uniref:hypothetical protein n=1 Tax=Geodermatophilus sp. URMC 62 TaxID=3423414 RepID=UPI00406CF394
MRATPVARRVVALDGVAGDGTAGDGTAGDRELSGCRVLPQADGDLGTRVAAAFADAMGCRIVAADPCPRCCQEALWICGRVTDLRIQVAKWTLPR